MDFGFLNNGREVESQELSSFEIKVGSGFLCGSSRQIQVCELFMKSGLLNLSKPFYDIYLTFFFIKFK